MKPNDTSSETTLQTALTPGPQPPNNFSEQVKQMMPEIMSVSSKSNKILGDLSDSLVPKSNLLIPPVVNMQTFVIGVGLANGMAEIVYFLMLFYQKDHLRLSPQRIQIYLSLTCLPWCLKPLFGYLFDVLIPKLQYTRFLIVIAYMFKMVPGIIFLFHDLNVFCFYFILFFMLMGMLIENIACEYLLVVSSKEANERHGTTNSNHLPYFLGSRGVGQVLGNIFGARIIQTYPLKTPLVILGVVSLLPLILSILYLEKPHKERLAKTSFKDQLVVMKRLVTREQIFAIILLSWLANFTPNIDMVYTFFETDQLNFSSKDLSNLATIGMLCYVIGLAMYSKVFRKINPKLFYVSMLVVLLAVNASFLFIVTGLADDIGINKRHLTIMIGGIHQFLIELNVMPIVTIWCAICPQGLEATSITLLTGLNNLSVNLAKCHGSFACWVFGVNKNSTKDIWKVIAYQGAFLLVIFGMVLNTTFPDVDRAMKEVQNDMQAVTEGKELGQEPEVVE